MLEIDIPGGPKLILKHLVLDYNGTIAIDGQVVEGVKELLAKLSAALKVHVVTADTFGNVRANLNDVPCEIHVLEPNEQDRRKLDYVESLGEAHTVCIGNGRNDILMLERAAVGIAVVLGEGAFAGAVAAADIVCSDILSALELFIRSKRLQATLRN